MFNNGTTYAGRLSPILQTLLNFFGRKRHSVSSEIVYPIKASRPRKSGTYPLRLNKGVPSEYLHFLVFCLIQNRQNPTSYFIHFVFAQFISYLVVLSNFLTVLVFFFVTRNQPGFQASSRYSSERRSLGTERKFS